MSQNEMHFDVAIIGAGFSGTMVAVHLFKDGVAFRINWGWRGILEINRASKRKVGRRGA
jgi:2-polyprenyl-6-methoxyphenol hydroxylase-like FAD-dependent oxidoreductase